DACLRVGADGQAAEHAVEERADVVRPLRPAERDDEHRVVGARLVVALRIQRGLCQSALPTKKGPRLSRYCAVCSVLRISCTTADSGCSRGPRRPTMKSLSFRSRPWQARRTST